VVEAEKECAAPADYFATIARCASRPDIALFEFTRKADDAVTVINPSGLARRVRR
jgi:hypothetical protein